MSVGRTVVKADIDENMADLASTVLSLLERLGELQKWNLRTAQADLTALGYTTDEAFLVKTVLDRLQQTSVWLGGGSLPPDTHDTVSDLAKFVGMGAV